MDAMLIRMVSADFTGLTVTRNDGAVNFDWRSGSRGDGFDPGWVRANAETRYRIIDPLKSDTDLYNDRKVGSDQGEGSKSRPAKDQPFYHLLAENEDSAYVAYVSEQNLLPAGVPPIDADPPVHTWTRRLLLP